MGGPQELAEKITRMTRAELIQFIGLTVGECNLLTRKIKIVTKTMEEHGCFCEESYFCMGHDIEKQWDNL